LPPFASAHAIIIMAFFGIHQGVGCCRVGTLAVNGRKVVSRWKMGPTCRHRSGCFRQSGVAMDRQRGKKAGEFSNLNSPLAYHQTCRGNIQSK